MTHATIRDEDGETTLWQCNDCGRWIPLFDELCPKCDALALERSDDHTYIPAPQWY